MSASRVLPCRDRPAGEAARRQVRRSGRLDPPPPPSRFNFFDLSRAFSLTRDRALGHRSSSFSLRVHTAIYGRRPGLLEALGALVSETRKSSGVKFFIFLFFFFYVSIKKDNIKYRYTHRLYDM